MPIVSHLPGTTVFPVRIPFGHGRGEMIDLPGLARHGLDSLVLADRQFMLTMSNRINAKQFVVKPGQSFVISNLFRITPAFIDMVLLACPFTSLECHVTTTENAVAILAQESSHGTKGDAKPEVATMIAAAGVHRLEWDVTKHRTGSLTSRDAGKLTPRDLPFVVFSTDIVVEGLGWIELAVQVRKSHIESSKEPQEYVPVVEVFGPAGVRICSRRPLNIWAVGGRKRKPVSRRTSRPRRSKKGEKKRLKLHKRLSRGIGH